MTTRSPLTIGVVCFPTLGGSGVVATELARALAEQGHRIHLLATGRPERANGCEGIHFHPVDVPTYPLFEHAPYTVALATQIVEVHQREKLDILHVHYAVPHAVSAYLARQALGAAANAPAVV